MWPKDRHPRVLVAVAVHESDETVFVSSRAIALDHVLQGGLVHGLKAKSRS